MINTNRFTLDNTMDRLCQAII